jgi:hypothetical protein
VERILRTFAATEKGERMRKILSAIISCTLLAMPTLVLAQTARGIGAPAWMSEERWQKMLDSAAVEIPKLVTTLAFLGLGWVVGKQLTVLWSRRQKQNEQDLDAARDFHALYGDFLRSGSCGITTSVIWEQPHCLEPLAGSS